MKTGYFHGQEQKCLLHFYCLLLVAFLLATPAIAPAQAYFGTVTGVLTDATGAVIPGSKVTLTFGRDRPLSLPLHSAGRLLGDGGDAGL
jgi:hypothetical protein